MPFNQMGNRRGRPFARMRGMRAPIVSYRQVFDKSITLIAGAVENDIIASADQGNTTGNLNIEVGVGVRIYRIRVIILANGTGGGDSGNLGWYLAKSRDPTLLTAYPDPNAIGGSKLRNFIFRSEYDKYGSQDGKVYKFDRWIKIPKLYQRQRDGDRFFIKFQNGTGSCEYTIHCDYKAYE